MILNWLRNRWNLRNICVHEVQNFPTSYLQAWSLISGKQTCCFHWVMNFSGGRVIWAVVAYSGENFTFTFMNFATLLWRKNIFWEWVSEVIRVRIYRGSSTEMGQWEGSLARWFAKMSQELKLASTDNYLLLPPWLLNVKTQRIKLTDALSKTIFINLWLTTWIYKNQDD